MAKDEAGLTPACAGKTRQPSPACPQASAHPRMRGEDHKPRLKASRVKGSPPHARGRQRQQEGSGHRHRLTPACAGKTRYRRRFSPPRVAHPRMRGEDLTKSSGRSGKEGSPPHARGRRRCVMLRPPIGRLTPACAGKTGRRSQT